MQEKALNPKVTSEKPSRPTLWLDTSVAINLTKIAQGTYQQDPTRLNRLRVLIQELGAAGKLLCPRADQDEEYVRGTFDREIHSDLLGLSFGVNLRHRKATFEYQAVLGMKSFVEQRNAITVPLLAYFYSDPGEELDKNRQRQVLISAHPIRHPTLLAEREAANREAHEKCERYRIEANAEARTYKNQFALELCGFALEYEAQFERIKSQQDVTTFLNNMDALMFLSSWKAIGGKPPTLEGMLRYFRSSHFHNLPSVRIQSQFFADLITGHEEITQSDLMDVQMLAAVLPVCHFILADNRMAARIAQRKIDKEWNTKVYSMSTISQLFAELEALANG